ncbi:MAG: PorT family protein [Acidobacteria bacterium]|nr:PorT family protein [Acidobacteriota bacterium]
MSKKWFILILLLTLPVTATADANKEKDHEGFMLGFHGSFAISSHWSTAEDSGSYERSTGSENGYSFGVFAVIPLGGKFSLQPEIYYVEKGANHTINIQNFPFGDFIVTYCTDYIEIPVLLKFTPFEFGNIKFFMHGGLYLSFLLTSEYEFENDLLPNFTMDIETLESTDFGFAFGNGFLTDLDGLRIAIEYRYSMSFTDNNFPTGPGFPEIELRNYVHMFILSLGFTL